MKVAKAKAKALIDTFIVQASLRIVNYDHYFIVQATVAGLYYKTITIVI